MRTEQPLNELTRYGAFYRAGLTIEANPDSDPRSPESLREDVVKQCIIDRASDMWKEIRQFKERPKRPQLSIEECFASGPDGSSETNRP